MYCEHTVHCALSLQPLLELPECIPSVKLSVLSSVKASVHTPHRCTARPIQRHLILQPPTVVRARCLNTCALLYIPARLRPKVSFM